MYRAIAVGTCNEVTGDYIVYEGLTPWLVTKTDAGKKMTQVYPATIEELKQDSK